MRIKYTVLAIFVCFVYALNAKGQVHYHKIDDAITHSIDTCLIWYNNNVGPYLICPLDSIVYFKIYSDYAAQNTISSPVSSNYVLRSIESQKDTSVIKEIEEKENSYCSTHLKINIVVSIDSLLSISISFHSLHLSSEQLMAGYMGCGNLTYELVDEKWNLRSVEFYGW